jgi:S1-C subfamily serine protease
LTRTVTMGVVSGVRKMLYGATADQGCPDCRVTQVIQTDTPINPGNSGGPLCNSQGLVIGITSFKRVQAEPGVPSEGIGFAIPSNTVRRVVDEIVRYGRMRWPVIGAYFQVPTASASPTASVPVVIQRLVPGGPAEAAGLQPGDQIVAVNGQPVRNWYDLIAAISVHDPGDRVTVRVLRGGRNLDVAVVLGEAGR